MSQIRELYSLFIINNWYKMGFPDLTHQKGVIIIFVAIYDSLSWIRELYGIYLGLMIGISFGFLTWLTVKGYKIQRLYMMLESGITQCLLLCACNESAATPHAIKAASHRFLIKMWHYGIDQLYLRKVLCYLKIEDCLFIIMSFIYEVALKIKL